MLKLDVNVEYDLPSRTPALHICAPDLVGSDMQTPTLPSPSQ